MKQTTIDLLRCPFCGGAIGLKSGAAEDDLGVSFGVAVCAGCFYEFPIVGGVLISAEPGQLIGVEAEVPAFRIGRGVSVRTLCRLIEHGRHAEAFSRLLNPAAPGADLLVRPESRTHTAVSGRFPDVVRPDPHRAPRIPPHVQGRLNRLTGERLLRRARRRVGRFLLDNQDRLTALEAIDLYMARYSRDETALHFAYSFGQPRHLAALSVASVLKERGGPILDLACGPGHLTHYFSAGGSSDQPVVGVDRNFFRLWVARNFVAPEADFICQWVDRPLPFATGSFDSVFCSDAFHLVLNKAGCVREARRVIQPDGLVGIVRFGNSARGPREGHELSVGGYEGLFSEVPHLLLGEDQLVSSYLRRRGPDLRLVEAPPDLEDQKWLSAILSADTSSFREYGPFHEWPHAAGRMALNPIYVVEDVSPSGDLTLRFEFPSDWYAFENAGYLEYAPASIDVPARVLLAMNSGERTDSVRNLIDRFVVVGVPERYMPKHWPAG